MGTILYTTDVNSQHGFRAASFEEVIAGARHALSIRVRKGTPMTTPKAARDYLTMRLAPREHEVFTILFLDSRHRLIECLDLFRGIIDGAGVLRRALAKAGNRPNAGGSVHGRPRPPHSDDAAEPGWRPGNARTPAGPGRHV